MHRIRLSKIRSTLTWRVFVNAGWAGAAAPITVVLGVAQAGMLARLLGPQGLGTIALMGAVSGIVGGLLTFTSGEAAMVYMTKSLLDKNDARVSQVIRYCYSLDFLTSLVAFGVVALAARFLPHLLNLQPGEEWLQVLFGLMLVFQSTYWVSHALLRVADRFSWTFYQSVGLSVARTAALAVLFVRGAGLTEVVLVQTGLALVTGVSMYLLADLALRRKGLLRKGILRTGLNLSWWRVPREVWRFEMLGFARTSLKAVYNYLDVLVIGFLSDVASIGLFRSARQLTDLFNIPTQALVSSLTPEYSRLWFGGEIKRLRRLVLRFSLILLAVFGVFSLFMILFSHVIIQLIFGDAFSPAREPLLILLVATFVSVIMVPLNSLQGATGRAGPATAAALATIVVQIVLMLVLIPSLGIAGAAWARVGGLLASAAIMLPTAFMRLRQSPTIASEAQAI